MKTSNPLVEIPCCAMFLYAGFLVFQSSKFTSKNWNKNSPNGLNKIARNGWVFLQAGIKIQNFLLAKILIKQKNLR